MTVENRAPSSNRLLLTLIPVAVLLAGTVVVLYRQGTNSLEQAEAEGQGVPPSSVASGQAPVSAPPQTTTMPADPKLQGDAPLCPTCPTSADTDSTRPQTPPDTQDNPIYQFAINLAGTGDAPTASNIHRIEKEVLDFAREASERAAKSPDFEGFMRQKAYVSGLLGKGQAQPGNMQEQLLAADREYDRFLTEVQTAKIDGKVTLPEMTQAQIDPEIKKQVLTGIYSRWAMLAVQREMYRKLSR